MKDNLTIRPEHVNIHLMNKYDSQYSWLGWCFAIVIGIALIVTLSNDKSNEVDTNAVTPVSSTSSTQYEDDPTQPAEQAQQAQAVGDWRCVDATSYNQNAYDDNKCTDGNETRYVSDSQAESLDPSYLPGKAGAAYYNSQ